MKQHPPIQSQRKGINNRLTLYVKRTCPYNHIKTKPYMDKIYKFKSHKGISRLIYLILNLNKTKGHIYGPMEI